MNICKKFSNINNLKIDNILNIILLTKKLTIIYIICYTESVLKNQILLINNLNILNNNLIIMCKLTSNPYLNSIRLNGLFNNWKMLQKKIILIKWLFYLIYFINIQKIKLPISIIIRIFNLFLKLKKKYWNIINITTPTYVYIFSDNINNNLIKECLEFNKNTIFIINSKKMCPKNIYSITGNGLNCLKLILEFLNTAYIQGKLSH